MESMGVATGCGCKEVFRFPHTTYPYSSCIFYSSIPAFFLCFSFLYNTGTPGCAIMANLFIFMLREAA